MRLRDLPVVSSVVEAGADDRVFDFLLLAGPLLIGAVVVLDRSLFTGALAVAYLAAFVTYTLYRGLRGSLPDASDGQ
jgi:hypothetical protein